MVELGCNIRPRILQLLTLYDNGSLEMPVPTDTIWQLEPHTAAKHELLKFYLQRWFRILSTAHKRLNYIDGFCGPGRYLKGEKGSPLVAIDAARGLESQVEAINFLFTDERPDRIAHLKQELSQANIPSNFKVASLNQQFTETLHQVLARFEAPGSEIDPTFVFIDPFGFAGVPYQLIKRILAKPRCETFITFMVNSVNRFLTHPEDNLRQHMVEIFGTSICFQITGENRMDRLRDLYQKQLERAAEFVRYFEMQNIRGQAVYLLFFATNNRLGHIKMKEAMWAVDPYGEFKFSDRTSDQAVLFQPNPSESAWPLIYRQFRGKQVTAITILKFVEDKTPFLGKHMKAALLEHEQPKMPEAQRIRVGPYKTDGTRRVKNTYPDNSLITFPD